MALANKEITSNGQASQDLSFSFDYLAKDDIKVFVDGVAKTRPTDWDFLDSNTIDFVSHPASGAVIRIERQTPAVTRNVDFQDGSVLSEADLDDSARQIFFVAQEASDTANDAVRVSADGTIDAQSRRIKNVASPTDNADAVNLGFLNTNITAINNVNNNMTDVNNLANNMADINAVEDNMADINAVENNLTQLNEILDRYKVSATAPSSPDQGDIWYDTNNDNLYTYNGSAWILRFGYDDQTVRVNEYTATAGQTDFSGSDANSNTMTLVSGSTMFVYLNGILIEETDDYTRADATNTITLTTAAVLNDELRIFQFNPFSTSDHNLVVNSAADAQKLAINAEDSQFTLSNSTTGYSALHYKNKAQQARNDAQTARTDAQSARDLAEGYRDTAETYKNQAQNYRDTAESHKDAAATSETNAANSASAAQTSANAANSPWSTNGTEAVYSAGNVEIDGQALELKDSTVHFQSSGGVNKGIIQTSTGTDGGVVVGGVNGGGISLSGFAPSELGVYSSAGNPSISYHHGDNSGTRQGFIQAKAPFTNTTGNGFFINPEGTGKADYTTFGGLGFRNRGALQYLGSAANSTDIASIIVTFADYGFSQDDFELIMIRMRNVGSTASSAVNFRFYFNGTVYSGAAYRYTSSRALYDGSTQTNSNSSSWNSTSGRFAYNHDSTSHDSWAELWIPNVGKNSYVSYSGTAYQIWWGFSRGVDGSSRPMVYDYSGYVNTATSRTDVTGIWLDSTSGSFRQTQIEVYGLPRAGVGGIAT